MADEVLALRRLAVIVKAIADVLLRPGGVEGDIEEILSRSGRSRTCQADKTGAGVVALIAQDTIQFQRMPHRLVDLQNI